MVCEKIRRQLNDFYFGELQKKAENIQRQVFSKMNAFDEANPNLSSYRLKSKLYACIAEEITPILFADIPYYFETGALVSHCDGKYNRGTLHANGWLYMRNEHIFCDLDEEAYAQYIDDKCEGIYVQTGTYVDLMHYGIPLKKIFALGLKGVFAELKSALADELDLQKREFLECSLAGIDALYTIQKKFALEARTKGMDALADIAERVPYEPPTTFHEGLCVMAFMRKALGALEGVGFNSFGRVDVLLSPLYEADSLKGISREIQYDLVKKFLLIWDCTLDRREKLQGGYEYEKENTLTLGGCDENGNTVFNEVTRLFIEARNELNAVYPKMMLRYSVNSPREYIDLISSPLLEGKSFSLFENDDVMIPALINHGVEPADAAQYCVGGCWDAITPDVSIKFSGEYLNLLKPLTWLIDCSYDVMKKRGLRYEGIEECATFEEVYNTYLNNVKKLVWRKLELMRKGATVWCQVNPLCCLSALMETCVAKRLDVTAGGGKYNWESVYFSFFGDVIDSLLAIKALCFDKKVCTMQELFDECRLNWKNEALRQMALHAPSYGDGSEESSRLAGKFADDLYLISRGLPTRYGGEVRVGSNQYTEVIFWGKNTMATPNGRRNGDYISMGLSPSRFQASVSVVEILDSLRYIDLRKYAGNTSLTLTLPAGRIDKESLINFFYAAARSGAQGVQLNCVSKEVLLMAQKEPGKYGHIIVRVCGFSAPFVLLSEEYQNEFISRLSEGECI